MIFEDHMQRLTLHFINYQNRYVKPRVQQFMSDEASVRIPNEVKLMISMNNLFESHGEFCSSLLQ